MTTEEKLAQAKKLMLEVTKERKQKIKDDTDNDLCQCGHPRKHHTHSLSINFTEGFCKRCKCENFLMK